MDAIINRIKRHEGCRLRPYRDSLGFWTVGWGHKMESIGPSILADGITQEDADRLLIDDILKSYHGVSRLPAMVLNNCNDVRKGILIEMCFQLGYGGVLKFKRMLRAIQNNDFERAANEMVFSLWHSQTPTRCQELSEVMRHGRN